MIFELFRTYLVEYIWHRYVVITLDCIFVVNQQIHDIGHCRRCPSSSLCIELRKWFWAMSVSIRSRRVFYSRSTLQQQGAQPSIFPWMGINISITVKSIYYALRSVISDFSWTGKNFFVGHSNFKFSFYFGPLSISNFWNLIT